MREFDRAAALGENREQTSSDRGSTPLEMCIRDSRLTADHGNAETMVDENGGPMTAHTTNPVMLALVGEKSGASLKEGGRLCDLAPTLLELMDVPQPPEMTGVSLLNR